MGSGGAGFVPAGGQTAVCMPKGRVSAGGVGSTRRARRRRVDGGRGGLDGGGRRLDLGGAASARPRRPAAARRGRGRLSGGATALDLGGRRRLDLGGGGRRLDGGRRHRLGRRRWLDLGGRRGRLGRCRFIELLAWGRIAERIDVVLVLFQAEGGGVVGRRPFGGTIAIDSCVTGSASTAPGSADGGAVTSSNDGKIEASTDDVLAVFQSVGGGVGRRLPAGEGLGLGATDSGGGSTSADAATCSASSAAGSACSGWLRSAAGSGSAWPPGSARAPLPARARLLGYWFGLGVRHRWLGLGVFGCRLDLLD